MAFVHADHARHDPDAHKRGLSGLTYASMAKIAEETGLRRETVTRITKRLVCKGVLTRKDAMTAEQRTKSGRAIKYRVNLALETCDAMLTGDKERPVSLRSQVSAPTCDSERCRPVILEGPTCDSPITQRVLEGKEEECSLMQFPQDQQDAKLLEPVPTRSQIEKAIGKTAKRLDPATNRNEDQRAHLESGIYRNKIGDAYFDATKAGMTPDECVREAITAGTLTLAGNRSVELKGLRHEELAEHVWERLRNSIQALHGVKDFDTRSQQVVAVVTRAVTDATMEFWERHAEGGSKRI